MSIFSECYSQRIASIPMCDLRAKKAEFDDQLESFVGTRSEIKAKEAEFASAYKQCMLNSRREYNAKLDVIINEWKDELFETYGTGVRKVDEVIYSYAYDDNYSDGYEAVEDRFMEGVEFAEAIRDALLESFDDAQTQNGNDSTRFGLCFCLGERR